MENPRPAATLEEFREQMGALAAGRSDEGLAKWKARLDRLAEWVLDQVATQRRRRTGDGAGAAEAAALRA